MGRTIATESILNEQRCNTLRIIRLYGVIFYLLLFSCGCTNKEIQPTAANLGDLSADAQAILGKLPNVVKVTLHGKFQNPTHRIVHILDWHYVSKNDYRADLQSQSAEPISDEEIDRLHADHLNDVERIQQQQMDLLRMLIQRHSVKQIYKEGLDKKDVSIFEAKVSALREFGNKLLALKKEIGSDGKSPALKAQIEELESQHRIDLLQLGAAGRLLLSNELEGVLPLEEAEAFAAANPVGENGEVFINHKKNEDREDALLRILMNSEPLCILVLGGAHDLSDNLLRIPNANAEYLRVECQAWKEITEGN